MESADTSICLPSTPIKQFQVKILADMLCFFPDYGTVTGQKNACKRSAIVVGQDFGVPCRGEPGLMHASQIECNAPLNAISTRVEREPNVGGTGRWAHNTSNNDRSNSASTSGCNDEASPGQGSPERIFSPLPRAHETAVSERQRTLKRIDEKESRLSSFLEQTKARVSACEDSIKELAKAEALVAHEKTKRRLNQSVCLIPKPTAALPAERADAESRMDGRGKARGGSRGGTRASSAKSAKDIAAELGREVFSDLSEVQVKICHRTWVVLLAGI